MTTFARRVRCCRIAWGYNPVLNLSHDRTAATHALGLSLAGLGVFAIPLFAVAAFAIFLSVGTRNSAAAIVGALVYALAQEALGALVHLGFFQHYLLSDQLDGWQGLFHSPTDWTPVTRAIWVSAIFIAIPLAAAFLIFQRRNVAGE
jgi:hypothetical protein